MNINIKYYYVVVLEDKEMFVIVLEDKEMFLLYRCQCDSEVFPV